MDNVSLWLKLLTGNTAQVLLIGATVCFPFKTAASCEGRTHDLQIMRLTRCLLRQRGYTSYACIITMRLNEYYIIIELLLHQVNV